MSMSVEVTWDVDWPKMYAVPELTFKPSAEATKVRALALRHERKNSSVTMTVAGTGATLRPSGKLGHIFEYGRRGGYPINPKSKKALAWGNGQFFSASAVGGAMRPYPYVRPAAAWWASGGYNEVARAVLSAEGL